MRKLVYFHIQSFPMRDWKQEEGARAGLTGCSRPGVAGRSFAWAVAVTCEGGRCTAQDACSTKHNRLQLPARIVCLHSDGIKFPKRVFEC